jgi:hypothetical protein
MSNTRKVFFVDDDAALSKSFVDLLSAGGSSARHRKLQAVQPPISRRLQETHRSLTEKRARLSSERSGVTRTDGFRHPAPDGNIYE